MRRSSLLLAVLTLTALASLRETDGESTLELIQEGHGHTAPVVAMTLSADGQRLFFQSNRFGTSDVLVQGLNDALPRKFMA